MSKNDISRYPKFNDPPYIRQVGLSVYGRTPLGELIWLIIPVVILALALILR